jgi:hypothetical protein
MSRWERRSANTVPKSNPKPSPFSSLLSIKNRRAVGDTGVISDASLTDTTGHSATPNLDATPLPEILAESSEHPVTPDTQTAETITHPLTSDVQTSDVNAHPVPPDTRPVQMSSVPKQSLVPDIQAAEPVGHPIPPPVRLRRTSGVTNPTAVSLAQSPLGKRSHPDYTRMTVYVRKEVHDEFNLVTNLAREEMSEIVERLIADYAKSRKKDLVRSLIG